MGRRSIAPGSYFGVYHALLAHRNLPSVNLHIPPGKWAHYLRHFDIFNTINQNFPPPPIAAANERRWFITKPFGFSAVPFELAPLPRSWVETTGNLVYWGQHQKVRIATSLTIALTRSQGGHFAALEQPEELMSDLVNFVEQIRPKTFI